jgi:hypothetical protein
MVVPVQYKERQRAPTMALTSDNVLMLVKTMNQDLSFYDDLITFLGLFYAGKLVLSVSCSLFKGIHAHFLTKIWTTVDLAARYGKWAGNYTYFESKNTNSK